jgi:hypothetical protein
MELRQGTDTSPRKQAESVKMHSRKAKIAAEENKLETAKDQAMRGFDTRGDNVPSSLKPLAVDGRNPAREQVIPKEKRTEAITKLEKRRDEAKKKRMELERKVAEIENKPNKTEEEKNNLANFQKELPVVKKEEDFINISINEELKKPSKLKKQEKEQEDEG